MTPVGGAEAYHQVATRIVARYLEQSGMRDVQLRGAGTHAAAYPDIDLSFTRFGAPVTGKVKADAYCGTDERLIQDRTLPYYRGDGGGLAFEVISDAATRSDGWAVDPDADRLYYYRLALGDTDERVAEVLALPDDAFIAKIGVIHDDLMVIPMKPLSEWFREHGEGYASRPVDAGDHTAWYKVVPRTDVERAIPGIESPGQIFGSLA